MAITTSAPSGNTAGAWSLGKVRVQKLKFTAASGATDGTATFDGLSSIDHVEVQGVVLTAAPTFSNNIATIAFTDPAATVHCTITAYGR
jgi:hypothetical protein